MGSSSVIFEVRSINPDLARIAISTSDNTRNVEVMVQRIFQDSAVLPKVLEKQHKLQSKLFKMILSGEDAEDDVKRRSETKPNVERTRTTLQLNPSRYSYKNTLYDV